MSLVALTLRFWTVPPATHGSMAQVTSTDPNFTR
jgi:hypothetical protein